MGVVSAVLFGAGGCGNHTSTDSNRPKSAAHAGHVVRLPSLRMLDVGSGRQVDLASYQPKDKALLVWAWAPH